MPVNSMATARAFAWVVNGTGTEGYTISETDRLTIRRQAMTMAGQARRTRTKGMHPNQGQFPVFVNSAADVASAYAVTVASFPEKVFETSNLASMSDLLSLTSSNHDSCPTELSLLIRQLQSAPYFNHLPDRFGHSTALDEAVHALGSKIRAMLDQSNPGLGTRALGAYLAALKAVREAIESEQSVSSTTSVDVLLASELLRLVEVSLLNNLA
jgi:hypothetical protein